MTEFEITITLSGAEAKALADHLAKAKLMELAGLATPGIENRIGQRVLDEVIKMVKER